MTKKKQARRLGLLGLLPLLGIACSSGGTDATSGDGRTAAPPHADPDAGTGLETGAADGAVTAAPRQLTLNVHQARQHRTDGKADTPLLLSVTLGNGKDGAPVPLNAALFKLRVRSGLLKSPTVDASPWIDGVTPSPTDALAAGATFGPWRLAFAIDAADDPPLELTFEIPGTSVGDTTVGDGRRASVTVSLEKCTTCTDPDPSGQGSPVVCTYLDRDPHHCGACTTTDGNDFGVYGGTRGTCKSGSYDCATGASACATDTGRADGFAYMGCFDLSTASMHCGKCGQSCGASSCKASKCAN